MAATDDRPAQQRGLLRGLSADEEARRRQLANLRQNASERHGAYVEAVIQPLAQAHRVRLTSEFPTAAATRGGGSLIDLASRRLAMLDRFEAFLDGRGPIRANKGRADVEPAAREARQLLDSSERAVTTLMALEREQTAGASGETLAQAEARVIDAEVVEDDTGEGQR